MGVLQEGRINSHGTAQREETMNTGLFHDDDGNIDDRRIAAWLMLLVVLALAALGVFRGEEIAVQLVEAMIWPTLVLFGATVAEKFKGAK
jgi:hypothetical protein